MRKTTVLSALTLATVVLAGCGSADKDTAAPVDRTKVTESQTTAPAAASEPAETTTSAPVETTTSAPVPKAADGSRDNPFELGQSGQVGDWLVTVLEFDKDANKELADANLFNDKAKGTYVTTKIKAVYTGSEEGTPGMDIKQVIIADAKQYADYENMCTPPERDSAVQTLMSGGEAVYYACFDVPKAALSNAEFFIEDMWAMDDTRTFFKLEK